MPSRPYMRSPKRYSAMPRGCGRGSPSPSLGSAASDRSTCSRASSVDPRFGDSSNASSTASLPEVAGTILLYRLVKQKHARNARAGHGGLEADGRWHTAGRPIVYLASSEALAVLEFRVHLGSIVPANPYVLVTVE